MMRTREYMCPQRTLEDDHVAGLGQHVSKGAYSAPFTKYANRRVWGPDMYSGWAVCLCVCVCLKRQAGEFRKVGLSLCQRVGINACVTTGGGGTACPQGAPLAVSTDSGMYNGS